MFHESKTWQLAAVAIIASSLAVAPGQATADPNIYDDTLKSTTWVLAKGSDGMTSGTGVLVDDERKLVITNAHVIGDARSTVIFFPDMDGDRAEVDREHYKKNARELGIRGQVIAVDRKRDLALIELSKLTEGAQAIEMATKSVTPGTAVHSIGNPGVSGALWVYSGGKVRAVYKKRFRTGAGEHNFEVVETDSLINSGDSGGPVVNTDGQLVAVAQAIAPKARGISYFVNISEIKAFLDGPWKPAPRPIAEVLKSTDLEFTKHTTGHFEVRLDPNEDLDLNENTDKEKENNEMVSVFVSKEIEYYERADVRKIWTLTEVLDEAPNAETSQRLLLQSSKTKIGAWTIAQNQNDQYMIVYCVKLDATASADALKSTLVYVAKLSTAAKKDFQELERSPSSTDRLSNWLEK